MKLPQFHFRGFPEFLHAAAEKAGRPDLAGPASRVEALAALSVLCSQAVEANRAEASAILKQASEFRDQLRITFEAADAMLTTVSQACGIDSNGSSNANASGDSPRKRSRRRTPSQDPTTNEAS